MLISLNNIMLSSCCIFSNNYFLQEHRHKHRNHEYVSILPEILGMPKISQFYAVLPKISQFISHKMPKISQFFNILPKISQFISKKMPKISQSLLYADNSQGQHYLTLINTSANPRQYFVKPLTIHCQPCHHHAKRHIGLEIFV